MPERQDGEVGYQGLELGVIWLAVDGDFGAGVDLEVSLPCVGGFFPGQAWLDDGGSVAHG
ncbi:hypothetical protein ACK36Q_08790 [Aeromonas veronii]